MRHYFALCFLAPAAGFAWASAGFALAQAQQPPDPVFVLQALAAVQAQRNQAFDDLAGCRAGSGMEITMLKERIAELEKAAAEKK